MIKSILTVGDSFTYGEELVDRNLAWPSLLANKLQSSVTNLGKPAASNDKILRTTIEHIINNSDIDLIVIGWSNIGRLEYADEFGYYDVWPGYQGNLFRQDGTEWRNQLVDFVSRYHNSEAIHQKFIQQVILLQKYLDSVGIPYVMLNIVENEYYKKKTFPGCEKYFKQVNIENFMGFRESGMAEWTYGLPQGPNGHFLEAGHRLVAEKIYEHLRNLGRLP